VSAQPLVLAGAVLLLAGVMLSKTSARFGVPSLLLFLFLGMVAGSEGIGGIEFDDVEMARNFGVVALAFILFDGGLGTQWARVRGVLAPGVSLATVGVLVTALLLGGLATLVLDLDPAQGFLLGAIIASTDAAAVFSILRSRGVGTKGDLRPLLELESGSNDPAAVFLTVGFIGFIEADQAEVFELAGSFVWQMGLGAVAGFLMARGAAWVINRALLEYDGLYPVLMVAFVLLTFEGVVWLGGSGFLAAYVAGVTLADTEFLHKRSLGRFLDAISWLMQIAMFVVLGLLVFPSELVAVAGQALLVALLLMFVARPLAVVLTLAPFRRPWREVGFVSWVGLRGATPVILATFPVVAGIDGADTIFHVVFFVVLTSVLIQGTTIPVVARLFGVDAPADPVRPFDIEAVMGGPSGHRLHELPVPAGSPAVGTTVVELNLPPGVLIVLVARGDDNLVPQGRTVIEAGDRLLVLAEGENLQAVRRLLESPTP
jgi:potassium/hydrogen antiporter